jgi:hypothetical protein
MTFLILVWVLNLKLEAKIPHYCPFNISYILYKDLFTEKARRGGGAAAGLPIQTRVYQHKHTNMAALFILPLWVRGNWWMYTVYIRKRLYVYSTRQID